MPNKVIKMESKQNGKNFDGDKERTSRMLVVAKANGKHNDRSFLNETQGGMFDLIDARFWMARNSNAHVVYCTVWVHAPGYHTSGHGTATGYGYHKPSAALQSALNSAGIELELSIDGVGEQAMETALRAIARKLGYKSVHVTG